MPKKYNSDALEAAHATVEGLHRIGLVGRATMRDFDVSCLSAIAKMTPEEISEVRTKAGVSQAVFARYLNVTTGLVAQWEQGRKKPSGAALKLLTLVRSKGLSAIA